MSTSGIITGQQWWIDHTGAMAGAKELAIEVTLSPLRAAVSRNIEHYFAHQVRMASLDSAIQAWNSVAKIAKINSLMQATEWLANVVFSVIKQNLWASTDAGSFMQNTELMLNTTVFPVLDMYLVEAWEERIRFFDAIFIIDQPAPGTKNNERPITHRFWLERIYSMYESRMWSQASQLQMGFQSEALVALSVH